VYKRAARSVNI